MDSDYKVLIRDYFGPDSGFLRWEEGCPLVPAAVQVSLNRETGKEHLQLRFRNISGEVVNEFAWRATVRFADSTTQDVQERHLDVDLNPGGMFDATPITLSGTKTVGLEVRILNVEAESDPWASERAMSLLPPRAILDYDEHLLAERSALLLEKGASGKQEEALWTCSCGSPGKGLEPCRTCGTPSPLAAIPADGQVQNNDKFWICACGQPNVHRDKCWSCGCSKELLLDTESIESIQAFIDKRAQGQVEQGRKKKASRKRAGVMSAIAIAAVVVLAGVLFLNYLDNHVEPRKPGELPNVADIMHAAQDWTYADYDQVIDPDGESSLDFLEEYEKKERAEHYHSVLSDLDFDKRWAAPDSIQFFMETDDVSFAGRPSVAVLFFEGTTYDGPEIYMLPTGEVYLSDRMISYGPESECNPEYWGRVTDMDIVREIEELGKCPKSDIQLGDDSEENDRFLLESLGFQNASINIESRESKEIKYADALLSLLDQIKNDKDEKATGFWGSQQLSLGTIEHKGQTYHFAISRTSSSGSLSYFPEDDEYPEMYVPSQIWLAPTGSSRTSIVISPVDISECPDEIRQWGEFSSELDDASALPSQSETESDSSNAEQLAETGEARIEPANDSPETPYYSIDTEGLTLKYPQYENVGFEYYDGFDESDMRPGGTGFTLSAYEGGDRGKMPLFFVSCYSGEDGPGEERYANAYVGSVDSDIDGALRVYVEVPFGNQDEGEKVAREDAQHVAESIVPYVVLKGEIDATGNIDYILPESDSKMYTRAELEGLSVWELYLARNEVFARYGRQFKNDDLADYFSSQPWYNGEYSPEDFDGWFSPNEYEKANMDLILEIEHEQNSPYLN